MGDGRILFSNASRKNAGMEGMHLITNVCVSFFFYFKNVSLTQPKLLNEISLKIKYYDELSTSVQCGREYFDESFQNYNKIIWEQVFC